MIKSRKYYRDYLPIVREINTPPVTKSQYCGDLMLSLLTWTSRWANSWVVGQFWDSMALIWCRCDSQITHKQLETQGCVLSTVATDTLTPGHQYLEYWLDIDWIGPVSYKNITFVVNDTFIERDSCLKKKNETSVYLIRGTNASDCLQMGLVLRISSSQLWPITCP